MNCSKCEHSPWGIELSEVYDGISFWWCRDCDTAWSRWTGEVVENWHELMPSERIELGKKQRDAIYDQLTRK